MKLNYLLVLFSLFAFVFCSNVQEIKAQDTLVVEWWDGTNLIKDALRLAIEADTLRPEGRVYKLRKGGYYWLSETITNNGWHLRIVGEDPDPSDQLGGSPAVLQIVARDDGSYTGRMITGGGSITLKNLYFLGCDDAGVQGSYYQPIQIDASDSRFVIDNCIFERNNFAIVAWTAKNNDIFLTNNVYRNLIEVPPTQLWTGRGVSIWADQDTVVVENNTFFNVNFTALQIESGAANYVRFNHNTLVNIGRAISTTPWLTEAYFANNLIINGFWHGEAHNQTELESPNRDPRSFQSGIFGFAELPSKYGPEAGRRILFANNAAWLDPAFTAFYADSIRSQPFIGQVTRLDFFDPYEQIVANDTTWLTERPDFPTYPDDILDEMMQHITGVRSGSSSIPTYFWQLPMNDDQTICNTCPSWPLPEDFSYTSSNLLTAGTDGLPLGDLNWFPTQKAQFEQNKDQYVEQMQSEAGGIIQYPVIETVEAEDGTLGSGAVVEDYAGELPYFRMEGGGYVEWKFNMDAAQSAELGVWTRRFDAGNTTRGQFIKINGQNIRNNSGYGEWYWDNNLPENWQEFRITKADILTEGDGSSNPAALDLVAGENTLRIEKSWGYQHFLKVDIIVGGNVVATLDAANYTTLDILTVVSPDPSIYVPSGFQSVNLGNNGTITWSFNAPEDGEYALNIFYQAPGGEQTGTVQGVNVTFASQSNQDGLSVLSGVFPLTTGEHDITLTASGINADWVQFVQKKVVTGIKPGPKLPEGFTLSQNYPNPFNPKTNINFSIGKPSQVKLFIYDVLGRRVATLINAQMNSGSYTYEFDASRLASGVYFYSLEAGDFKVNKKMMLLK